MTNVSLCIDLGGTSAKCAIIKNGEFFHKYIVETKIGSVVEHLAKKSILELEKLNLQLTDLDFIGLSVCGLLNYEQGMLVWSGNLKLDHYALVEEMQRAFQNPNIFILNDAKAATYGEWTKGQNRGCDSMFLYTIGTGIGGGLIIGKKLRLVAEPGHGGGLQNVFQCNCDLDGCIEGLSSSTGVEKVLNLAANKKYIQQKLFLKTDKKITIKDIVELIQDGDEFVLKILRDCWRPLAQHISIIQHTLNLDKVVIGGGPSQIGEPLIKILKDHLKTLLLPDFYNHLNLEIAALGNDAGIWGIYAWSLESLKKSKNKI